MTTLYSDLNQVKIGKQRNAIINGNFLVWQRGASFNPHSAGYTSDRWYYSRNSTGSYRIDREGSIRPHSNTTYSYKLTTITGQASFTGDNHSTLQQCIEGFDYVQFIGKTATLSFWVRSSVAGTYSCAFRNGVGDRSYVAEYTINNTNTWEYKTITLKFDYSGGTWNYTTGIGLQISFTQMAGATYKTSTTNEWISGNYIASSAQVNNAATIGNTFQLAQCQLELGSVASEYENINIAVRTRLLLRYYQSIYISHAFTISVNTGIGIGYLNFKYKQRMRSAPTVTTSGTQLWNPAQGWKATTSITITDITVERLIAILYDNTYSSYLPTWPLLAAGSWFLDARL